MPRKLIPRDDLLDIIIKQIRKGRHIWLNAPEGFGKTTLLREASDEFEDSHQRTVIFCQESCQFKPLMLEIAEQLHSQQRFTWDKIGDTINEMSWAKLHAKLNRPPVLEITPVVMQNLEGGKIILILDHLERANPSFKKYYAQLFEITTVIAASNGFSNNEIKNLRPLTRVVDVPKLTQDQATELSDFLYEDHRINATDEKMFKRHTLLAADGIISKLVRLYEDASLEKHISADYIRNLRTQAGREYINMGLMLLLLVTMPMIARIMAVGSGDRDAYIAFGMMSAFAFVMRQLISRENRKTS